MTWSIDGTAIVAAIVAAGTVLRYLLDRHDARLRKAADDATAAQAEAMGNKNKEIDGWQRRYELEHADREKDAERCQQQLVQERSSWQAQAERDQQRIAHLENLLFDQRTVE